LDVGLTLVPRLGHTFLFGTERQEMDIIWYRGGGEVTYLGANADLLRQHDVLQLIDPIFLSLKFAE
jgi:hypothetical protein